MLIDEIGDCDYCGKQDVKLFDEGICRECSDDSEILGQYEEDCEHDQAERAHDTDHRFEYGIFYEPNPLKDRPDGQNPV